MVVVIDQVWKFLKVGIKHKHNTTFEIKHTE